MTNFDRIDYDIDTFRGFLGSKNVTAGNIERYRASVKLLLDQGIHVSSVTATVTSTLTTVAAPLLSSAQTEFTWDITTTTTTETFTLSLAVTLTDGQVLNYTVIYHVIAPVVDTE